MIQTIKEKILTAIRLKLEAMPDLEGRVLRSRVRATDAKDLPVVLLETIRNTPNAITMNILQWTMRVRIMVFIKGEEYEISGDQLVSDIHNMLMLEQEIQDLVVDFMPVDQQYQPSSKNEPVGAIDMTFEMKYRTNINDLTFSEQAL